MTIATTHDRLRALIDVLVASLDDPAAGEDLARRAYLSRFHFDRLVAAGLGEPPAAFRRRLLLERAAYELATTDRSVTDIAFAAGFGSLEAFTRAFGRTFGTTPSGYRDRGTTGFRVGAPNGVHFHPPGGLLLPADDPRRRTMALSERMIEHDNWLTRRLIDDAAQLSDMELDEPVPLRPPTPAFAEETPSIRAMLNRLVFTKEMWTAAIAGRPFEESRDTSLDGLRGRLAQAGGEFAELVRDIEKRAAWDTAFVDALCEPPETFTFGGAIAHVLTWDAHRRQLVAGALREHGIEPQSTDPIAWERGAG